MSDDDTPDIGSGETAGRWNRRGEFVPEFPVSPNPVQPADAGERLDVVTVFDNGMGLVWSCTCRATGAGASVLVRKAAKDHARKHLAAREAAWAEKYAAVVGERDALQVCRTTSPCGCRHPLVAGCDHSSAEAALATALREKAEALAVCDRDHGREGNPARVYGHHGSRRTCIRVKATDQWVYDPAWEARNE